MKTLVLVYIFFTFILSQAKADQLPFHLIIKAYKVDAFEKKLAKINDSISLCKMDKKAMIVFPIQDGNTQDELSIFIYKKTKIQKDSYLYEWIFTGNIKDSIWNLTTHSNEMKIHISYLDIIDIDTDCNLVLKGFYGDYIQLFGQTVAPYTNVPKCTLLKDTNILKMTMPDNNIIEFYPVPPGSFYFGSQRAEIIEALKKIQVNVENEGPQQKQKIQHKYWISKFELTEREFLSFLKNNKQFMKSLTKQTDKNDSRLKDFYRDKINANQEELRYPLTKIKKDFITNYIKWLNASKWDNKVDELKFYQFDLPTEIEWEYAAKGPSRKKYYFPWGNDEQNAENKAVFQPQKKEKVGSREKSTFCKVHDLAGNVYELVKNKFFNYSDLEAMKKSGWTLGSKELVARGGAYTNSLWECRTSIRYTFDSEVIPDNVGVRIFFVKRQR